MPGTGCADVDGQNGGLCSIITGCLVWEADGTVAFLDWVMSCCPPGLTWCSLYAKLNITCVCRTNSVSPKKCTISPFTSQCNNEKIQCQYGSLNFKSEERRELLEEILAPTTGRLFK